MKLIKEYLKEQHLPDDLSNSGATRSEKSGSSPYQKIHNSFAAVNDNGGCVTVDGNADKSKKFVGSGSGFGAATRCHTHKIPTARHFEYEHNTGSSKGSDEASGRSA